MPLYNFSCPCGATKKRFLARNVADASLRAGAVCPECGGAPSRDPQPPTTNQMEQVDNGVMVRRVERPLDTTRLIKERGAPKDPNKE